MCLGLASINNIFFPIIDECIGVNTKSYCARQGRFEVGAMVAKSGRSQVEVGGADDFVVGSMRSGCWWVYWRRKGRRVFFLLIKGKLLEKK